MCRTDLIIIVTLSDTERDPSANTCVGGHVGLATPKILVDSVRHDFTNYLSNYAGATFVAQADLAIIAGIYV